MINYSIGKTIEIISSCDESFAIDTKYFDVRNIQRIWDFGLIFETFLNNPLMGLSNKISITLRLYIMKNTLWYNI